MSELAVLNNQELTMSSLEIAELTGKRHDHVIRDIKKMLNELEITHPKFGGSYIDSTGRRLKCYYLPKRETLILVSGYNMGMRAKIIDRWQELEEKQETSFEIPQTLPEALRLAANLVEENLTLRIDNEKKSCLIDEYQPKAEYLDQILSSTSLVTITQIAKDYGMSGRAMNELLHEIGIQYKINNQWLLYSQYQSKGYTQSYTHLRMINVSYNHDLTEVKMVSKWTQKGRLFLYNKLKYVGILPMLESKVA
ncbi:MAG: Rha family transcriptional regulator [Gammaproteobacteria bacterium]|nr:MAG: Rha family transcriptional regulator [Gammaproteobacteria bacterium]UTW43142.1 phage regulatory protein/antirepressor Ant [bacterium SCSIO 12844]